jgi:hypothetical protein
MYGNKKKGGERYNEEAREYVEVSDVVYCERQLYLFYCLLSMHCWVSFWGVAEVYFEYTRTMKSTKWEEAHQLSYPLELIRKHVSQMFFRGEVEQELRETGRDFTFQSDADMEGLMRCIEQSRVTDLYTHCQNAVCIE